MSIVYRLGEGVVVTGTNATRAITAIGAGGVITLAAALGNGSPSQPPAVGDTFNITLNSNTANNCLYTLTAVAGAVYTIRPAPILGGTLGSLGRRVRATTKIAAGVAITDILALGGTGSMAVVTAPAASFITNNVVRGDRLVVVGDGTAANNGAWFVVEILSEDKALVVAPDGGLGMTTNAAPTGTLSVRHGVLVMEITDELAITPVTMAAATPKAGPSDFLGPGPAGTFCQRTLMGGFNTSVFDTRAVLELFGFTNIVVDQSGLGAPSTFISENDVILNRRTASPGAAGGNSPANDLAQCRFTAAGTWGAGNVLDFRLGRQDGDRYSAVDGTALIGVGFTGTAFTGTQRFRNNGFGSYVDCVAGGSGQYILGTGGDASACLVRPTFTPWDGVVEEVNCYGNSALVGVGAGDQNNILVASQNAGTSYTADATIGGLLISDQTLFPLFVIIPPNTLTLLDPRADYALNNYFNSGFVEKKYTYNPRHVHYDSNVDGFPIPIAGRRVTIDEVNVTDFTTVNVYSGTTDALGYLQPTPDPLRTQRISNTILTNYYHVFTETGGGFPPIQESRFIHSRIVSDYSLYVDTELWTKRIP